MTTLTTHDTKRGEDVRARLHALAEIPERVGAHARPLREPAPLGDGPLEQLLWQAVVGAWPAEPRAAARLRREGGPRGGRSTTWTDPAEDFETAHARGRSTPRSTIPSWRS